MSLRHPFGPVRLMEGPKLLWLEVHHDLALPSHRDRAAVGRKLEPRHLSYPPFGPIEPHKNAHFRDEAP